MLGFAEMHLKERKVGLEIALLYFWLFVKSWGKVIEISPIFLWSSP